MTYDYYGAHTLTPFVIVEVSCRLPRRADATQRPGELQ
jgi:hypothetical protein